MEKLKHCEPELVAVPNEIIMYQLIHDLGEAEGIVDTEGNCWIKPLSPIVARRASKYVADHLAYLKRQAISIP